MNELSVGMALFLLLNVAAGLVRIVRGPTQADRMMAAQLFGTTGVAILLLLAQGLGEPALRDVALVLALLSGMAVAAFVRRAGSGQGAGRGGDK
jgi:multicomponent Na+:H+ antiporter subunit F